MIVCSTHACGREVVNATVYPAGLLCERCRWDVHLQLPDMDPGDLVTFDMTEGQGQVRERQRFVVHRWPRRVPVMLQLRPVSNDGRLGDVVEIPPHRLLDGQVKVERKDWLVR